MKFSELWLREWINIELDSEMLSKQITMAGLEVDNIESVSNIFNGVIVGEIVECKQYSNTNKLYLTKINTGNKHLLNIVCSASNCRQGLKVAVATTNAALSGDFKIKAEKLRSELSEGMLCSFSELGISENHNSIIELPTDAPIGTDVREYLKLNDNIIEVRVTPNRADCLSIIGLARDITVLNHTEFKVPQITPIEPTINDTLPIQVDAPEGCPRYLGRLIKNINVKVPTPLWMKEKLRRCGICTIDTITDITNYVLLELGQPVHAFDKDLIKDGIVVRMATEGETVVLPDEKETKLSTDTLVVADYSKVLAIGGISYSKHYSVNKQTKNVLLECALFNPLTIIGCARRHDLHTIASHRYERGVDSALQYRAMERVTYLLVDICGGEVGPIIDVTSEASLPKHDIIILRRSKLDRLIGYHISDTKVSDILRRLGCEVIEGQNEWRVIAPSWRFDMEIEEDLVEEIARIYGYNNIPNKLIQTNLGISSHRESTLSLKRVKTMLNDKGYQEVITYSFVDLKLQQLIHPGEEALILPNPISNKMSAMRLSLWNGLLKTVVYNQNRQQSRVRIFETGLRFVPDVQADLGIRQDFMLAGAISGNRYEEHWDLTKDIVDFYDMKGDLESIFDLTGKLSEVEFRAEVIPALHPGQSATIYLHEERVGFIGVIHPELEHKLDLNSRTIIFELEWNKIANRIVPHVQEISHFPTSRRDIAVVVAEDVPAVDILTECKKISSNRVVNVKLFDIYRGNGIAKGYKSFAISLIFQDTDRTLEEEEIATIVTKCIEALKERFQASLRN